MQKVNIEQSKQSSFSKQNIDIYSYFRRVQEREWR